MIFEFLYITTRPDIAEVDIQDRLEKKYTTSMIQKEKISN